MAPPKQGEQLVKAIHNNAGPLTVHTQKVMVKLTAPTTDTGNTAELDFVAVLDTSGSMRHGTKLIDMQRAMEFVIANLGANDRLAIVNFDSTAHTLYTKPEPANKENIAAWKKAKKAVRDLKAKGDTNIGAGLETAMQILRKREDADGFRAACIFLMSDGAQNRGDAKKVLAEHMPGTDDHYWTVHTFGFGENHDETLLWEIARKSHGGVYHHVLEGETKDPNNLAKAFAPTLGKYRSISMLGVEVTVTRRDPKATISVKCGDYRVEEKGETSTIKFGDLAREEYRRIMIDVQLPAVTQKDKQAKPVLEVEYTYNLPVNKTNSEKIRTKGPKPVVVAIARDGNAKSSDDMNQPEVELEIARNRFVESIEEVKKLADKKPPNMAGAMSELTAARSKLYDIKRENPKADFVIGALFTEVDNIELLLNNTDYAKLGRAYLHACLSSHHRQRYTERGGEDVVPFFLTGRSKKYQQRAAEFKMDPQEFVF